MMDKKNSRDVCNRLAAAFIALAAFGSVPAFAETATLYGNTASMFTRHPGAFLPANSDLVCYSMDGSKCWDGKRWHALYPSGRRSYAEPAADKVACRVIVTPGNDCWTGSVWYRLPKGQIFGVIGGFLSNAPGAFITAPLQPQPETLVSASPQTSLGKYASTQ